jgi:hypothetical protein
MTQLTVANSGSVGMPWDGDPRACYLFIEHGCPRSVRINYDVEREAALLRAAATRMRHDRSRCAAGERFSNPARRRSGDRWCRFSCNDPRPR